MVAAVTVHVFETKVFVVSCPECGHSTRYPLEAMARAEASAHATRCIPEPGRSGPLYSPIPEPKQKEPA